MEQYINKSALVTEIEKMLQDEYACETSQEETGYHCALYELEYFLNTLEVKEEVTTDAFIEKAEKWLNDHILDYVYAKEWGQGVGIEGELFEDFKNAMKGE